jgi:hypothetical protein
MLRPRLAPQYERGINEIHNGLASLRSLVERQGGNDELRLMGQADIALLKLVNGLRKKFGWQRPPLSSLHTQEAVTQLSEGENEDSN